MGYQNLVNVVGGMAGRQDYTGRQTVPGWVPQGLATTTDSDPERTWDGVRAD
jgi:hypothetical protein